MEPTNLETASSYVNNLLLSRGLLRNGTPIDFARPSKSDGGKEATAAQIINLVHDLVLRRDREMETMSTLSENLQMMRVSSTQHIQDTSKLESRNAGLERQLAFSIAQERTAKASLRTAESKNRILREEMLRLKTTVSQIRGQCANEIRKRDGEIKRIKRHIEGRRGRDGVQVGVLVISPTMVRTSGKSTEEVDAIQSRHSLREETTQHLTQLCRDLSNENDAMANLLRKSLFTLRSLQGLPALVAEGLHGLNESEPGRDPNLTGSAAAYENMASEMSEVLENLRELLTNPSFVPLEEVEIREDEILRLRQGWERMEARWKEAVLLMDGWRKRMMESGDTINLDDLRLGLNLGAGMIALPESLDDDISEVEASDSVASEGHHSNLVDDCGVKDLPSPEKPPTRSGVPLFPPPKILQEASGNRRRLSSPRHISFRTAHRERREKEADEVDSLEIVSKSPSRRLADPIVSRTQDTAIEPEMTVQQKLRRAELEAQQAQNEEQSKENSKPVKRTAIPRKMRSKRRSTLSPEELEGLMGIAKQG